MYGKEEDKQFKKRKFNSLNWKINEEGFKICPDGRVFDQYGYDRIQYTRNDNLSITQIYTEKIIVRDARSKKNVQKESIGHTERTSS